MLTEHQERHAAALAARPVDADGHPLCACGAILDGPSVDCEDCRGRRHEREIERSMLANNRHAALDHLSARWAWVEDDAAYFGAVKSPKLRGVAARYTLDAGGLLVLGGSGKGKTASVNRALRRLVRAATRRADVPRVVWTTAAALVGARIEQKFGEHEAPLIGKARAAPVLVVDVRNMREQLLTRTSVLFDQIIDAGPEPYGIAATGDPDKMIFTNRSFDGDIDSPSPRPGGIGLLTRTEGSRT